MAYDIFSQFYDSLTTNVEYEKRADYFCSLLSECGCTGGIMLDLACGTGTMSVEMSKRGFDVIGVDPSVGMLNKAREKCFESEQNVLLLCQQAQELDLYGTIDCAICVLDSINHLPGAADVQKAFDRVSLFMNKGGVFAFDVNTIYKHREILGCNTYIYDCGNVFCAWQNTFNENDNSVDISLDFFSENSDGTWERSFEEFSEQAYEIETIKSMLRKSGFEVAGIYEDLTHNAVTDCTDRAVFLARKV